MDVLECFGREAEEKIPKVVVRRDGSYLDGDSVQAMTVRELGLCAIRIFDTPLVLSERGVFWGKSNLSRGYNPRENALVFLQRTYALCEKILFN